MPFILSAALVLIGLYVRVSLHETPVFAKVAKAGKQVKVPLGTLLSKHPESHHPRHLHHAGDPYTLFYLMTVYSVTYGTAPQPLGLGYSHSSFLWMLMVAVIGFGVMVPIAGLLADAFGRQQDHDRHYPADDRLRVPVPAPAGSGNQALVMGFPCCMAWEHLGLTFGPDRDRCCRSCSPTQVRYTPASFSYNLPSISRRLRGALYRPLAGCLLRAVLPRRTGGDGGLALLAPPVDEETRHRSL